MARHDTARILLAVAAPRSHELAQFDVLTALLCGYPEGETTQVEQPEGLEGESVKVCLLKHGLYGSKQPPPMLVETVF